MGTHKPSIFVNKNLQRWMSQYIYSSGCKSQFIYRVINLSQLNQLFALI